MTGDHLPALQGYIERSFPELVEPRVFDLVDLNSGWESDVAAFQVEHGLPGSRRVEARVLRIYPGASAEGKATAEYAALARLHSLGYSVPAVDRLETSLEPFGRPFLVMEKVDGRSLRPLLFNGPQSEQPGLLRLFCGLFVQLHRLDWLPYFPEAAGLLEDPFACSRRMLDEAHWFIQQFQMPDMPELIGWLEARLPGVPCPRPALVHWDFHPDNILLKADGTAVVIDWTGAAISDARFDIAWTLLLVDCYQGEAWRARIQSEYERQAGAPLQGMDFFNAFACARRLASVLISLRSGAGALGMRPGAEQLMRQQIAPLGRVYARLQELTGIRLKEVEEVLSE